MKLITVIKMFGLKIVKSSYINKLKQDLDDGVRYSNRLVDDSKKLINMTEKLRGEVSELKSVIESINKDLESKDSHIVKMGNELSRSRELYDESVKEKEALKRAYMDIEKKHKLSSKLLDEARRRYKELEDQNKIMSDRIKYLEAEILDIDVPNEVVVDEDKMDPNSGHIDIPENNASEVADAGIDVNVENKAEDKKKSKKRKKSKKSE